MIDYDIVDNEFRKFIQRLKKIDMLIEYISVKELQERERDIIM